MKAPPRPGFGSDEEYEASLRDAEFWEPYARAALRGAGLSDEGDVVTFFPTTHPTVLIGERFFVKLHYEPWFGEECLATERAFYRATKGAGLPITNVLAEGALYEGSGWRWPFLILGAMPGRDLRSFGDAVRQEDMERVAVFAGSVTRRLPNMSVADSELLARSTYAELIRDRMVRSERDHLFWGSLPERLATSVRNYVWERRELVDPDRSPQRLIHGDLHRGNIFVTGSPGALEPTGIVDFNDAMIGDPHYELVSVHLKAFRADKSLLRIAFDTYGGLSPDSDWRDRMMAFTLVHDYDMIEPVISAFPGALDGAKTLNDVANLLWDLDAPGPADR